MSALLPPLVVLLFAGLTHRELRQSRESTAEVQRTLRVELALERTLSDLRIAQLGERGYLITGEERYLEPYRLGVAPVNLDLADLQRLVTNPKQKARADTLEALARIELADLERIESIRSREGVAPAVAAVRSGKPEGTMAEVRRLVGRMAAAQQQLLRQRQATEASARRRVTITLWLESFLAGLATIATALLFARHAAERERATHELAHVHAQLQDQAAWVEEQADEARALAEALEQVNLELVTASVEAEVARDRAEKSSERVRHLQAVTAALATADSAEPIVAAVISETLPAVGASAGYLAVPGDDAAPLMLVGNPGFATGVLGAQRWTLLNDPESLVSTFRAGKPVFVGSVREADQTDPLLLASLRDRSVAAFTALPLVRDGDALGVPALQRSSAAGGGPGRTHRLVRA